jgi:integrase/recombinase XerD
MLREQYIKHLKERRDEQKKNGRRTSSFRIDRAYKNDLQQAAEYLGRLEPKVSLYQATPEQLQGFLAWLRSEGYRPMTIQRKRSVLSGYYRYCHRAKAIAENPLAKVERQHYEPAAKKFLTPEQINQLIATPDTSNWRGARDRVILELLCQTGIRVHELVDLKVANVDFDNGCVQVKNRRLNLSSSSWGWLRHYLALRKEKFGEIHPTATLLVNKSGQQISARNVHRRVNRYAKVIGLAGKICPQVLRGSFAVSRLATGTPIEVLSHLLGNCSIESTRRFANAQPV